MFCMVVTPMQPDGTIDADGFRRHVARMADAGIGIYIGSGGSGEGHALTLDELSSIYAIGVTACRGRVPVYCNPPEARSAKEMLAKANRGIEAGVEAVQLYQLDAGHGRMPVLAEQERYFRDLLEAIGHPVALSIHSAVGYLAPADLVVSLCRDYEQVKLINLHGPGMDYFVRLKDALGEDVKIYLGINTVLAGLPMGAWGAQLTEPNQVPNLSRLVVDRWAAGDVAGAAAAYADVLRVTDVISMGRRESADGPKAAMQALGYDVGPPRPPRVPVSDATVAAMRAAFERLGIPERERRAAEEWPAP
jgi:4-hydroxy-tetrahydrodipicolinate synthase